MGVNGLLQLVEAAIRTCHISEFSGQTVAVDTYNWIYKSAYKVSDRIFKSGQLSWNEDAIQDLVSSVLEYVEVLRQFNVTPIMILDGRDLPIKSKIDEKRRQIKRRSLQISTDVDDIVLAKKAFRSSFDVNYTISRAVIVALRSVSCSYIVAPYEADAQIAFLSNKKIVSAVITEDSDLIAFGCSTILFKFDKVTCVGQRYDLSRLCSSKLFKSTSESIKNKLRWISVLTGCDYFDGISGIGIKKSFKILKSTNKNDTYHVIRHIKLSLGNISIPHNFVEGFYQADFTFKYQPVFDPIELKLSPLNKYQNDSIELERLFEEAIDYQNSQIMFDNYEAMLQSLGCFDYEQNCIHPDDNDLDFIDLSSKLWRKLSIRKSPIKVQNNEALIEEAITDYTRIVRPQTIALSDTIELEEDLNVFKDTVSQEYSPYFCIEQNTIFWIALYKLSSQAVANVNVFFKLLALFLKVERSIKDKLFRVDLRTWCFILINYMLESYNANYVEMMLKNRIMFNFLRMQPYCLK